MQHSSHLNYKGENTSAYWSPNLNGVYLEQLIIRTPR